MLKRWLLFLVFFLLGAINVSAAESHILSTEYFEDPSNKLQISQVQSAQFKPYTGVLNKGFSSSSFWIRLKTNKSNNNRPQILRIQPTFLDHVEIYQLHDNQWIRKTVGDTHPYSSREIESTSFGVPIEQIQGEEELYIKLKTSSTNLLGLELLDSNKFYEVEGQRDLFLGAFIGIALMLLIWVFFQQSVVRDTLVASLVVFLCAELLFLVSVFGFVSRYACPDDPSTANFITNLSVMLFGSTCIIYHRNFIASEIPVKLIRYAINLITLSYIVPIFLLLINHPNPALKITSWIALPFSIVFLCVPISWLFSRKFNGLFALGYFILGVALIFGVAANLGIGNAGKVNLYGIAYVGLLSSIIFIFLIKIRQKEKDTIAAKSIEAAKLSNLELAFEKTRRERQGQLIAMLTHELRTPLYLLRLVIGANKNRMQGHAEQAVDDMYTIIERCQQAEKFDDASLEDAKNEHFDPIATIESYISTCPAPSRVHLEYAVNGLLYSDPVFLKSSSAI